MFSMLQLALPSAEASAERRPEDTAAGRDAWLVSAATTRAVFMLGPRRAPLPEGSDDDVLGASRLMPCADRCGAVIGRERTPLGVVVTVAEQLVDVPPLSEPHEIVAAPRASLRFAEYGTMEDPPAASDEKMPDSLAPPKSGRSFRRAHRQRRATPRRPPVDWSDPGPWTGEGGLMAGPSILLGEPPTVSGLASARAGFRRVVDPGPFVVLIGNQVGADLRLDYLGQRPAGHDWAATLHPVLALTVPRRRSAVGGRLSHPIGGIGVGIGGLGRDIGFVLQYGIDASLLITRRFGLDFRCSISANFSGPGSVQCGLGGFVR